MKNQKRRRLLPLACAALLAVSAAGAEEPAIPEERPNTKKEYELVLEFAGPVEVSITHTAKETDAEPVYDAERIPAQAVVLKEGPDYDVRMDATEEGAVAYTVTLRDPSGEEEDRVLHRFEDIPVDGETVLKTTANSKDQNTLLAFIKEGEGENEKLRVHTAYGSGKNSANITVNNQNVILAGILLLFLISLPLLFRRRRKVIIIQKPILRRKG